ncbi:MAG: hypothetical protein D6806_10065, partial [Deltaproteobacteria bacterium]
MSMSAEQISAVVGELNRFVAGAAVQKIKAVSESGCLFSLRRPGRSFGLLAEVSREVKRLHLVERKYPSAFERAPDWVMLLRAELAGWRLDAAGCEFGGRRVIMRFARAGGSKYLGCDLFGAGALWLAAKGTKDARPVIGRTPAGWKDSVEQFEAGMWDAGGTGDREAADEPVVSLELERAYTERLHRTETEKLRNRLKARLGKERKKLERLVAGLERDLSRCEQASGLRRQAEVLKANLWRVPRGTRQIELDDFARPGEKVLLELDPSLDAKGNMERLFSRAKRLERGLPVVKKRLNDANERLSGIRMQLERLEDAPLEELEAIASK